MSNWTENFFRYLPVSPRVVRWGVYVTGVGISTIPSASRFPSSIHPELYQFTWEKGRVLPEYQVIYLSSGGGVFESSHTGCLTVEAGDIIILLPRVWHRYRPDEQTGWTSHWMSLNGSFINNLLDNRFITPDSPVLHCGDDQTLVKTFERMVDLVRPNHIENPLLVASAAMEILSKILLPSRKEQAEPATQPFAKPVEDRIVAEVIRHIWNNPQQSMTIDEIVDQFPVTRRSLERRFKRTLGYTIREEITRCRIERAKQLLEETEMPIKKIAITAGFSSAERLCKVFQGMLGLSPTEYRTEVRT